MRKYFELKLSLIEVWRNKDDFKTESPVFKIKIPCLGGDAYSKDLDCLLSKNTTRGS